MQCTLRPGSAFDTVKSKYSTIVHSHIVLMEKRFKFIKQYGFSICFSFFILYDRS